MKNVFSIILSLSCFFHAPAQVSKPPVGPPSNTSVIGLLPEVIDLQKIYTFKQTTSSPLPAKDPQVATFEEGFDNYTIVGEEVARNGDLKMHLIEHKDKSEETQWITNKIRLVVYSNYPNYVDAFPVRPGDQKFDGYFSELNWANSGNFVRQESYGGRPCFVYQSGDQTAWVDRETNLPVRLENSSLTIDYKSRPAGQLTPPANVAKILSK